MGSPFPRFSSTVLFCLALAAVPASPAVANRGDCGQPSSTGPGPSISDALATATPAARSPAPTERSAASRCCKECKPNRRWHADELRPAEAQRLQQRPLPLRRARRRPVRHDEVRSLQRAAFAPVRGGIDDLPRQRAGNLRDY
jgi:hypothetical protein